MVQQRLENNATVCVEKAVPRTVPHTALSPIQIHVNSNYGEQTVLGTAEIAACRPHRTQAK